MELAGQVAGFELVDGFFVRGMLRCPKAQVMDACRQLQRLEMSHEDLQVQGSQRFLPLRDLRVEVRNLQAVEAVWQCQ